MWGAGFVFGLVLLLVAPGFFYDVANACKKVASASGIGVLCLIAFPVAAVLVCVTIVGIPVGITALFLYLIALYSTQVFVGAWLGERILGAGVGFGPTLGRLALGLGIIRVLRVIPYLGALVGAVVDRLGPGCACSNALPLYAAAIRTCGGLRRPSTRRRFSCRRVR